MRLRTLAAVVGGASRDRPLRAEVRTAAARVVSDAIAHGLAHGPRLSSSSSKGSSSNDLIARDLENAAEKSGHSCAREAFSLADLTGDRERLIPGAGRTVQAAACVAAGALASKPGGSGLWGDEGGRSARAGSAKLRSAAEEMRDALRGALEEGDEETRGCAASALGALAAARLYPSEHTHATRVAPDGSNGGGGGGGGDGDDTAVYDVWSARSTIPPRKSAGPEAAAETIRTIRSRRTTGALRPRAAACSAG